MPSFLLAVPAYAQYVHQGFGQLTVATALTFLVVWAATRKAPPRTAADRAWIRVSLGLLCALTLVVVASALYRMHVHQDAYGFTRMHLLVDVFEGWLGLLVLATIAAGVSLRASWLPRHLAECPLTVDGRERDDWLEWNLGRSRARTFIEANAADWRFRESCPGQTVYAAPAARPGP